MWVAGRQRRASLKRRCDGRGRAIWIVRDRMGAIGRWRQCGGKTSAGGAAVGGRDEMARISAVTHARQQGGTSPAPTRAAAGTRLARAPHQAVAIGDDELAGLDCPHVASSAATRGVTVVVAAAVASREVVAAAVFATVVGWTLSCVRHRTPPARCEDDGPRAGGPLWRDRADRRGRPAAGRGEGGQAQMSGHGRAGATGDQRRSGVGGAGFPFEGTWAGGVGRDARVNRSARTPAASQPSDGERAPPEIEGCSPPIARPSHTGPRQPLGHRPSAHCAIGCAITRHPHAAVRRAPGRSRAPASLRALASLAPLATAAITDAGTVGTPRRARACVCRAPERRTD